MFDFLSMLGTYESRKVARSEFDWGYISTVSVTDGDHPYETAVAHKSYNDGELVIVQAYDTKADAEVGHTEWVGRMTADQLPEQLVDCHNAVISQLAAAIGGKCSKPFPRQD